MNDAEVRKAPEYKPPIDVEQAKFDNLRARMERVDIERECIATLLMDTSSGSRLVFLDDLRPTYFSNTVLQRIYKFIDDIVMQGRQLNTDAVQNAITRHGKTHEVNLLMAELGKCSVLMPRNKPDEIVTVLRDALQQRIMYNNIVNRASLMFHQNEPIDKISRVVEDALMQSQLDTKKGKTLKQAARNIKQQVLNPDPDKQGLITGLKDWDNQFGGLLRDRVYTIAGYTGSGKSMFVIDFIVRLCLRYGPKNIYTKKEDHVAIQFFSLEMSEERVAMRIATRLARISEWKLVNQNKFDDAGEPIAPPLTDDEIRRFSEACDTMETWPLEIVYTDLSAKEIRQKGRLHSIQNKDKHVVKILDHLGEVEHETKEIRQEMDDIMNAMKSFARKFENTSIPLAQLSKETEKGRDQAKVYYRPSKGFIMESVGVEAKSDILILLWRPSRYFKTIKYNYNNNWDTKHKLIGIVGKNRDGEDSNDIVWTCYEKYNELDNFLDFY